MLARVRATSLAIAASLVVTPVPGALTTAVQPSGELTPALISATDSNAGWREVSPGSASGGGISDDDGDSSGGSIAIAPDGTLYVAWTDVDHLNKHDRDVYIRRWNGGDWEEVGIGSASGGGLSGGCGDAYAPSVAIAPDGTPYIAWNDTPQIYALYWDGDSWEEVGTGSASGGGISNTSGLSGAFSLAIAPDGTPYVAWEDDTSGHFEIYVRRWNGSDWEEVGAGSASGWGISGGSGFSYGPSMAIAPDGTPYVAWTDYGLSSGEYQIFIRRWNGSSWEEVGAGSASRGALRVVLGDLDDDNITGMSGGWERSFSLSAPSEVVVAFWYKLTQAASYEEDELSQALVSVDGTLHGSGGNDYVAQIVGDGDGGSDQTTGWQLFEANVGTLSAGSHTLVIGGYNSKKTYSDESTEVLIDDVLVQTAAPLATDTPETDVFYQDDGPDGIVSMEGEHYSAKVDQGGKSWDPVMSPGGYSGSGAVQALPNTGVNNDDGYVTNSPRMDFEVDFVKTGTHYVWMRGYGLSTDDDSCHVGLDGQAVDTARRISNFATSYGWSNETMDGPIATVNLSSPGVHTVNVWMREDGFILDKIMQTTSSSYTPSGAGPAESPRGAPSSTPLEGVLVDAHFDAGTDGFSYVDDAFRATNQPAYASGERVSSGGYRGGGVSNTSGLSGSPSLAIAPDGTPYVAWQDSTSGDDEIYIRRWNGSSWEEVGEGSASGGGISDSPGQARGPSLAIAPDGTPYVAWGDETDDYAEAYVRRWNGSDWEEIGAGSASGGGISNTPGWSAPPSLAVAENGTPYIAWNEAGFPDDEIFVRQGPPVLDVAPSTLLFLAEVGAADPRPRHITVGSVGSIITWTATVSPTVGWLDVTPMAGTTSATITATATISGLAVNHYTTQITVDGGEEVQDSPQTIDVKLTVAEQIYGVHLPLVLRAH